MGKIVMTLLVRRKPRKKAVYPYAAQIVFPRELSHKKTTLLASVRLIDKSGRRASVLRVKGHDIPHPGVMKIPHPIR